MAACVHIVLATHVLIYLGKLYVMCVRMAEQIKTLLLILDSTTHIESAGF